jgi:hypothetical protein
MLDKAWNTFTQIHIIIILSTESCLAFIEENNGNFYYDKEKYRDMLLEAAETVLSIFGFNRTAYGDAPKKYKKWWQPLREERTRDRDTETI